MQRCLLIVVILFGSIVPLLAQDQPPRSRDPRIKIELFAEHPQIVTPTGIDVDHAGRVWAIESNTHFRPQDYKGHPTDRLLVMSDTNSDGRADKIVTFADGFTYAMSVVVRPLWFNDFSVVAAVPQKKDEKASPSAPVAIPASDKKVSPNVISVYVATRREVFLLHDDDGDLKADRRTLIARLDSKGAYPHNAINGFALHPLGWLYFGMGENLGAAYKLIGSDGTTLSGGGEGGNMFRCRSDGSRLERVATGFWNPHASCFDAFGRLFSVDNDPDSRPPCRLLHVIPGGDYGFRFRNGRKGLHPFTSWNGEIAGTLPMVAGTGEAPGGIVAYESDGLPEEYIGNLLVTSWGDHRIDRFRLKPKGASFTSLAEPVIVGGENFRPVGLACAPDGSLYCTDWMLRDYNLHGHGRVWRISATKARQDKVLDAAQVPTQPIEHVGKLLNSKRLDVRRTLAHTLAGVPEIRTFVNLMFNLPEYSRKVRVEVFWAVLRQSRKLRDVEDHLTLMEEDATATTSAYVWAANETYFDGWLKPSHSFLQQTFERYARVRNSKRNQNGKAQDVDNTLPLSLIWLMQHRMATLSAKDMGFALSLDKTDPFVLSMVTALVENRWGRAGVPQDFEIEEWNDPRSRLAFLLAFRRGQPKNTERLQWFLKDRNPDTRRAVVQWIAEERLQQFKPYVAAMLNDKDLSADLFLATLAALEMLDGVPPAEFDKTPPGKYVLPLVKDDRRPATVRALALRMVSPTDPALTAPLFKKLLATNDSVLKLETVRTLKANPLPEAGKLLRTLAGDAKQDTQLRLEAIAGLGRDAHAMPQDNAAHDFLLGMALEKQTAIPQRVEALRGLRGHTFDSGRQLKIETALADVLSGNSKSGDTPGNHELADQLCWTFPREAESFPRLQALRSPRPQSRADWLKAAEIDSSLTPGTTNGKSNGPGDAATGSRTFFHPNSAGCYKCHTINGRGGKIGPDLSTIGRSFTREKLLDSILEPSREIAPQFITWAIETRQGKVHTGMIVHENEGRTVLGGTDGNLTELKTIDIVERVPQTTSVMPEKLLERLTVQELRDLLAFLESLK